ncbi:YdiU family protein [Oceanicoccus sp. KOV_DT_Chl]|uniref:protein adenylyltransferase SelO n=1 Tax=Oceanicoccus sp. KOV_DT_Chl TaxID=1904639 RepID=UPI000C7DACF7|nr:YdiU family protein [Oceanicoccus sp. KOV_DT_Chl]
MDLTINISFDNSYIQVADTLFSRQLPTAVSQPDLIRINDALANFLSIDPAQLNTPAGIEVLAGNRIAEGSEPIATVYAAHQFGQWNPQLGDGRAILLGEVIGANGLRYDVQLKGSGPTPYSRGGDGRSPLGPVLREYIVSEAMYALGVPTTRSLAAVSSGDTVIREQGLPGAILTRVARSHIRIGTFQFFAAREDWDSVTRLADHVIARHYPDVLSAENPYLALLSAVIQAQAELIARWQSLGFIHGVMNTDNMLVGGETVDYGPCAFMDEYHAGRVYSSIDHNGRYAYGNQPAIAHWNLSWLAQSLLPLIHSDEETAVALVRAELDAFADIYQQYYECMMCQKIGLPVVSEKGNELVSELLALMQAHKMDFTLMFAGLADYLDKSGPAPDSVANLFSLPAELQAWLQEWQYYLQQQSGVGLIAIQQQMRTVNPVYIPRNHLIEEVIQAANSGDLVPFHRLVDRLAHPFDYSIDDQIYALPPRPEQEVARTFCGT